MMEDKTTINERIQTIINEAYNGNVSKFCREVGVKQPTMNTILGERKSKPSYDVIYAISNALALESISIEWLVTGRGSMLKPKVPSQLMQSDMQTYSSSFMIPFEEYKKAIAEKDEEIKDLSRRIGMLEHELQVFASQKQTALGMESASGVAIHRSIPEAE